MQKNDSQKNGDAHAKTRLKSGALSYRRLKCPQRTNIPLK
jgi:hypothetical protein